MKETGRNFFVSLLLLIPVILLNYAYGNISAIVNKWQQHDQERFAIHKLNEIAAQTDIAQQLSSTVADFKKALKTLIEEYPDRDKNQLPIVPMVNRYFSRSFPVHDLWVFKTEKDVERAALFFTSDKQSPRRPMEIVAGYLVSENLEKKIPDNEKRRNEKLLQKLLGNGCTGEILGQDQIGVTTPVIYSQIPSFLVWDYFLTGSGECFSYFLIVPRNQNLTQYAYSLAAKKSGLGAKLPGGFVNIYRSDTGDYLFPKRLAEIKDFRKWRSQQKFVEDSLNDLYEEGAPWSKKIGDARLYSRLLPLEKHLVFVLLPDHGVSQKPLWLKIINYFYFAAIIMLILRGLILGIWPFNRISHRFALVFVLAISLPITLFITSATAYISERAKADENTLEQTLTTSLSDFDAGKELLEKDYLSAFSMFSEDKKIKAILREKSLDGGEQIIQRILELSQSGEYALPLSGIALYDLEGNTYLKAMGNLSKRNFATMAGFYGLPFTINLRKAAKKDDPDMVLPAHRIDQRHLIAIQSFRRKDQGMEEEIGRFRGRVIRTDIGRGYISYIYDFLHIDGVPRFALMITWLDKDIDRTIIQRASDNLALKSPELKFLALKQSPEGLYPISSADRSISSKQSSAYYRLAEAATGIKSGVIKSAQEGMSIVAYRSRHFNKTVLLAGIEHSANREAHFYRLIFFAFLGFLVILLLVISAVATYFRLLMPVKAIKEAFSSVESGFLLRLPAERRNDEIGLLTDEFNKMIDGLEERQRLSALLSDQAVEAVASAASDGRIQTKDFQGVVLITDIRSFTTMCESNEPAVITSLLNTHFAEMAGIITGNGGRIYKFIGDAIEAVFIDDRDGVAAAERAVTTACQMIVALKKINDRRLEKGLFSYRIGVGLSYGSLIGGETGSKDSRLDYAILGSAFKKAEKLENLTRHFPNLPILADESVISLMDKSSCRWKAEEVARTRVFCLEESVLENVNESIVDKYEPPESSGKDDSFQISVFSDRKIDQYRPWLFWAGAIAIFFPFLALVVSLWVKHDSASQFKGEMARALCENVLEKVSLPDSEGVIFEEFIDKLCEQTSDELGWNEEGISADSLKASGHRMYQILLETGLEPSMFAVLHKPGGAKERKMNDSWKLVTYSGPESQREISQELMRYFALRYYKGWPNVSHIMDRVNKVLGTGMTFMHLYNDLHARVASLKPKGNEEYFYWQPLYLRNPEKYGHKRDEMTSEDVRKMPTEDALLQAGIFMCIVPKERVLAAHGKTIARILSSEPIEFAIFSQSGASRLSNGFPMAEGEWGYNKQVSQLAGWVFRSAPRIINNRMTQIVIGKRIDASVPALSIIFSLVLLLASFYGVHYWYISVYNESGIARRFSSQLWVGLIAAAVLPLSIMFSVNEWYAVEQTRLSLAMARMRLIGSFEKLERRQFAQEVVEWDKLNTISTHPELQKAIKQAEDGDKEKLKAINEVTNRLADEESDKIGQLRFTEMLIFHSRGWQHAVTPWETGPREAGEFKKFIEGFVSYLMADLGVSSSSASQAGGNFSGAVKAEMTRDAGLEIFRTVFGTDSYFRLVHGVGLPIKIFISTGTGCFKLIPIPSLLKPEMIIYWLFFDNLNSAMRLIFRIAETEFPVWAESKVMYGALKQPWTSGWMHESVRLARWALATKAPISGRENFAGRDYLVEARISSQNESMVMMGMIPEARILQPIEDDRRYYLLMLGLSVIGIILLSLLVLGDISSPVNALTTGVKMISQQRFEYRIVSSRSDELGQILQSFNTMARALQEKEVMGQMVSGAARRISSDKESLRLAEIGQRLDVTVLYISVPGFELLMDSLGAAQLIEDVARHIDQLCGLLVKNGGEVDKIMGEKILAYFFSSEGLEESNRSAFMAMNAIRLGERGGELPFPVSVGIHCGEVIAGLLGVGDKRDYTIIGDPVNTAARICARGSELPCDRFLLSEEVLKSVDDRSAKTRPFGEVALKGKAATVELCQVLYGNG